MTYMELTKGLLEELELEDTFEECMVDVLGDQLMGYGNSCWEMRNYILRCFNGCKTEREFEIANEMFCAFTGWNLDTFLDMVEEKMSEYEDDEEDEDE